MATDPQAFIIWPQSSVELARVIVASDSHHHAGVAVARRVIELQRAAHAAGKLRIAPDEVSWFDPLPDTLEELPERESKFIGQQLALADKSKFLPGEYGRSG